jgi:hypothetical protein
MKTIFWKGTVVEQLSIFPSPPTSKYLTMKLGEEL